ncbi:MAG: class I SAM-dependent methyltransferase [Aigarchaeota archaeon]|nr:class I SAM-dependent methyltransferase [Candidatus Pelearchaeum maunauluense]
MMTPASFDAVAEQYERVLVPRRRLQHLLLLEALELSGDEVVIDLGCGTGALTAMIAQRLERGSVVGVDASLRMLEHARMRAAQQGLSNMRLLNRPIEGVEEALQGGGFDAVVSSHVLHWLKSPSTLFQAASHLLRPGGKLGLIVASFDMYLELVEAIREVSRRYCPYSLVEDFLQTLGRQHYSPKMLETLLNLHGFKTRTTIEYRATHKIASVDEYLELLHAATGGRYLRYSGWEAYGRFVQDLRRVLERREELSFTDHAIIAVAEKS